MIPHTTLHQRLSIPAVFFGFTTLMACLPDAVSAGAVSSRPAHGFVNSMGLSTHFDWAPSPYRTRYPQVKAALGELGVRHIRDNIGTNGSTAVYRDLNATLGVRLTGMIDTRSGQGAGQRLNDAGIPGKVNQARAELGPKVLAAIEGPNEYNTLERDFGYGGWVGDLRRYQQKLFNQVKSDAVLRGVPVVAPALGGPNEGAYYAKLGDLSSSITHGSAHIYPNWLPFAQRTEQVLPGVRRTSPRQQVWVTETGWHQAFSSGAQWVSDDALVKYVGRAMASFASHPALGKSFYYQLVDPMQNPAKTSTAAHFGLLDYSLRRKPSYYAVRNTMHVMCDNPLGFAPQSLRYTLSGNLGNVRTLLYQKSNRAFYLVMWVEKQSFTQNRPIHNPPQAVNVRFEQPITQVRMFAPTDMAGGIANGNLPKRTYARPTSISLNAVDAITVLEIVPTGTAVPPVSTRCNFAAA